MTNQEYPGVKRPYLYIIAAVLAVAATLPMANGTGQLSAGGIFDECFEQSCKGVTQLAAKAD